MDRRNFMKGLAGALASVGVLGALPRKADGFSHGEVSPVLAKQRSYDANPRWEGSDNPEFTNPTPISMKATDWGGYELPKNLKHRYIRFVWDNPRLLLYQQTKHPICNYISIGKDDILDTKG